MTANEQRGRIDMDSDGNEADTEQQSLSFVHSRGWRAATKRWRRGNRQRLNRLLSRLLGTTAERCQPLAADTRRILVVRCNRRLGNILFLTPMLRSLATGLPEARIDVVIQDPAQIRLLQRLPGVDRIWIQRKSLTATLGLLRRLRRQRYDLAIDPIGNSASNRLALALCGARQRMGFAAADQWLPLTHASRRASSPHQARQSVELLRNAVSRPRFPDIDTLAVFPDASARAAASRRWQELFANGVPRGPVAGFFAQATGRKQLEPDWWQAWRTIMSARLPAVTLVQICPPGGDPLVPDSASITIEPLDELAAFLSYLDLFVAADSGPMHLAAAAGVPVIGLFRVTSPKAYAPLGARCVNLSGVALNGGAVATAVRDILDSGPEAARAGRLSLADNRRPR